MYEDSEPSQSDGTTEATRAAAKPSKANASTMMRCAYCGNAFEKESSPIVPFCSIRCHRVDLGMWLNESYSLPCEGSEDSELDDV